MRRVSEEYVRDVMKGRNCQVILKESDFSKAKKLIPKIRKRKYDIWTELGTKKSKVHIPYSFDQATTMQKTLSSKGIHCEVECAVDIMELAEEIKASKAVTKHRK